MGLALICAFCLACGPSGFARAESTPEVYRASGAFALGALVPAYEGDSFLNWEIEMGGFPRIDGSVLLEPVAEGFAQAQLNPDGALSGTLVRFTDNDYAMRSFLLQIPESNQAIYCEEPYVQFTHSPVNLLLLVADHLDGDSEALLKSAEAVALEFARGALVLVVPKGHPVESVTSQQARDLLTGAVANWSELDGGGHDVSLFYEFGGARYEIERILANCLLEERALADGNVESYYIPNGVGEGEGYYMQLDARYDNQPGSLCVMLLQDALALDDVTILAIDGMLPDAKSLVSGAYPLGFSCYAVYREADENSAPGLAAHWLCSEAANALITQAGFY